MPYIWMHKIGTLEENKYADIIILDSNLFSIPEEAILETKVLMTIMNGSVVYDNIQHKT